jgi:hypothetical protein
MTRGRDVYRGSRAIERGGRRDAALDRARARRSAWLLGLVAVGFYLGFIAWNLLRTAGTAG